MLAYLPILLAFLFGTVGLFFESSQKRKGSQVRTLRLGGWLVFGLLALTLGIGLYAQFEASKAATRDKQLTYLMLLARTPVEPRAEARIYLKTTWNFQQTMNDYDSEFRTFLKQNPKNLFRQFLSRKERDELVPPHAYAKGEKFIGGLTFRIGSTWLSELFLENDGAISTIGYQTQVQAHAMPPQSNVDQLFERKSGDSPNHYSWHMRAAGVVTAASLFAEAGKRKNVIVIETKAPPNLSASELDRINDTWEQTLGDADVRVPLDATESVLLVIHLKKGKAVREKAIIRLAWQSDGLPEVVLAEN